MNTRERIKAEVDKVQEKYLEALYTIIRAFEAPATPQAADLDDEQAWQQFITETYGALADDPIQRGDQGIYEIRERPG